MLSVREGVTIKTVGPFDLGRLARLHRNCFDEPWSRADLAHLLGLPGGFGLLARLYDRRLVGFEGLRGVGFALCRVAADEAELLSIGVAPNFRRRDVGAELLAAAVARCREARASALFLEVAVDNLPAQALYRRFGFVGVGRREGYYQRADGSRMSAYTMRRDLNATADAPLAAAPGPSPRASSGRL